MRYEHLVEINDPLNPLIDTLTRDQLWRGLLRYVESPVAFVEGLDRAEITARSPLGMHRALHFGRHVIKDTVTLTPQDHLVIATEASPEIPAGAMTVAIEEHGTERLYVRFIYETFPQGHPPQSAEARHAVTEAWRQAGIDVIRRIREYAEEGRLDRPH